MKFILPLCASIFLFPISSVAAGEIDVYLEKSTLVVAQIDVSRFDLPGLSTYLKKEFPEAIPTEGLTGFQFVAGGILQSLRGAGVTKIYATLSTLEVTSGHLAVIVPTKKPSEVAEQVKAIVDMVPATLGFQAHVTDDAIIVATDKVWKRLSELLASNKIRRAEIMKIVEVLRRNGSTTEAEKLLRQEVDQPTVARRAFITSIEKAAAESLAVTVNIRDDLRKAIVDVWPDRLPTGAPIEMSPKAMMQDVSSLQLALQTPPEMKVRVTATCNSAEASGRVAGLANQLLEKFNFSELKCTPSATEASVSASGSPFTNVVRQTMKLFQINAADMQQSNHLKQVILAVHNFHSAHEYLPPRMTVTEQKKPLLSWRVFLLPYLGEKALYEAFHLDEPWDSPHNLPLVDRIPGVYQSQQFPDLARGHTLVQMPLYPNSIWAGNENRMPSFKEITDGTSETICFVLAPKDKAVPWTKPNDLTLADDNLLGDLFGEGESSLFVFFDGSVRTVAKPSDLTELKAKLTHASGEVPRLRKRGMNPG